VVAREISISLKAPLSAIITRKIGHPNNPEYAIGAVAEDGNLILSPEVQIISQTWLNKKIKEKKDEAKKRREYILMNKKPLPAEGKTAIIVDDGLATGLTMELAIKEIKDLKPKRIIIAVAVAAAEVASKIKREGCELVALEIPKIFLGAIGNYYKSFEQVSDEEAREIFNSKK
jgi:predicted phosphoribosyltransferase